MLSVVIVSCKLCCLNAVSKRKTLPSLGIGPHACCGMFIATLQSRKLKLVTTCGLGASRKDRPTCGYNPPANKSVLTLVTLYLILVKSESFRCCDQYIFSIWFPMGMLSYAPYGFASTVANLAISSLVLTFNDIMQKGVKYYHRWRITYSVKSGVSAF